MARPRPDSLQVLNRKRDLIGAAIANRESASSTSLSASYGLPITEVQRLLKLKGVRDDG